LSLRDLVEFAGLPVPPGLGGNDHGWIRSQ
jgi:hypothetical protein